jgi:hypothetical protein
MIYISGAMSGIKDYNYPEFNRVAKGLRGQGHKVFNPAEIDINTSGMSKVESWMAYMEVCIPAIDKCKILYLLNGWQNSKGAKLELKRAIEKDLTIKLQNRK